MSPTLKPPGLPDISRAPGPLPMLAPAAPSLSLPAPASVKLGGGLAPGPQTSGSSRNDSDGSAARPDTAPVHTDRGSDTGSRPAPVVASGRSQGHRSGNDAPAPARAAGHDSGSNPLMAVVPDLGSGGRGSDGARPNPSMDGKDKGGPGDSRAGDPDFTEYMAELQRAIKRHWFPPKCPTSKRVQVIFKVHRNGTMSNLKLLVSSGAAFADQAALKAVQLAAPFRHLPSGSPEDVDIQFTFDYNVFKGTLR